MLNISLEFKTLKQEEEFKQVDPRVQSIVLFTAFYMKQLWDHQAVITSVKRDKSEQVALVKAGKGVVNSPHLDWRAADIRLNDFPQKSHINVLVDAVNTAFPRVDGLPTALAHGEKENFHLHLQVPKIRKF